MPGQYSRSRAHRRVALMPRCPAWHFIFIDVLSSFGITRRSLRMTIPSCVVSSSWNRKYLSNDLWGIRFMFRPSLIYDFHQLLHFRVNFATVPDLFNVSPHHWIEGQIMDSQLPQLVFLSIVLLIKRQQQEYLSLVRIRDSSCTSGILGTCSVVVAVAYWWSKRGACGQWSFGNIFHRFSNGISQARK